MFFPSGDQFTLAPHRMIFSSFGIRTLRSPMEHRSEIERPHGSFR